jgi:hypothetical protein
VHGAAQALNAWISAGADLLLSGHDHLPGCMEVRSSDHRHCSVLAQAGSCLSDEQREGLPNSWNLLTLQRLGSERRLRIEQRDYGQDAGRFAPARLYEAVNLMDRGRTRLNGWRLAAPAHT